MHLKTVLLVVFEINIMRAVETSELNLYFGHSIQTIAQAYT